MGMMTSGMAAVAKKKESFGDLGAVWTSKQKNELHIFCRWHTWPNHKWWVQECTWKVFRQRKEMKGSSPTKQCDIFQNTFDYRQTKSKETPPDLETWCFQWEFDESTFAGDWFQRSSGFLWFPPHLGWRSSKLYILFSYYFLGIDGLATSQQPTSGLPPPGFRDGWWFEMWVATQKWMVWRGSTGQLCKGFQAVQEVIH